MTDYNTQLDTLQTELDAWIDKRARQTKRYMMKKQRQKKLKDLCNEMLAILQHIGWQKMNNEFENSRLHFVPW